METICVIRDIFRAIQHFEDNFIKVHGLCLNEAIILCCLAKGELSATAIVEETGMTTSHTSKMLRSVEEKELVERKLGQKDKRQMYFHLTDKGKQSLENMKCGSVAVPEVLKPIFNKKCNKLL
ncbi:winged helix DNA-binding protein [Barnesiella propionica]|uniref:MarR family winged helix-turn-helix transcriptional regulator n=1 Tax=Barnesiella propionica TaxID=2981781 RepID=UPI0011C8BB53|nr:winged helix DNA-binding protein [Barnesiella propionica]MCU6768858.1 winged helix DNA-binding protein [Barnesiella propionica]